MGGSIFSFGDSRGVDGAKNAGILCSVFVVFRPLHSSSFNFIQGFGSREIWL